MWIRALGNTRGGASSDRLPLPREADQPHSKGCPIPQGLGESLLPTLQRCPRGPLQADALGCLGSLARAKPRAIVSRSPPHHTHTGADTAIAVGGPEIEAAVQARRLREGLDNCQGRSGRQATDMSLRPWLGWMTGFSRPSLVTWVVKNL